MARKAFREKDAELARKIHEEAGAEEEPWHSTAVGKYLGSAVYGASDGVVTTFAIVSGVVGAQLDPKIVLILGFANLFADGFSMAVGDYISEKSTMEYVRKERQREEWEVEVSPDGERRELAEIYRKKGLKGEILDTFIKIVTSNKKLWVETMMHEELGVIEDENASPFKNALVTFFSFAVAGFMPLVAYLLGYFSTFFLHETFFIALGITFVTLFVIGALRQILTGVRWYRGGLEMLLIGGMSSAVAYLFGFGLKAIFGISSL